MDFGDAFDVLADDDFWTSAVMAFTGYIAPVVAANVIEEQPNTGLSNELCGVDAAAGAEAVGGGDYRMITVGPEWIYRFEWSVRRGPRQYSGNVTSSSP